MSMPGHQNPPPYAPVRNVPRFDQPVTVGLLLLLVGLAAIASFLGAFFAMASDGCIGSVQCNYTLLSVGISMAMIGPWIVTGVAAVVAIVRMASNRTAYPVPLIGALVLGVVWMLGAILASNIR